MDKIDGVEKGQRVRVTFEAEVVGAEDGGLFLCRDNIVADKAWWGPRACSASTFQIERIEPPLKVNDFIQWREGLTSKTRGVVVCIFGDHAWCMAEENKGFATVPLSDLERIA